MKKSLLALFMSLAMIISLTACGGGGSSEAPAESAAEPNTGLRGIVFAVPEDWTVSNSEVDSYIQYDLPDSDFYFSASTFDEDDLANVEDEEIKTVQDFYDKYYSKLPDTTDKGFTQEVASVKICDSDAQYVKAVQDDKDVFEASTFWMMDNVIYNLGVYYPVEYDEEGNPSMEAKDIPALSDDELAAFEAVQASIQAGEGASLQPDGIQVDSLGDYSFEKPEGYSVTSAEGNTVFMTNRENGNTLSFSITDEEAFEQMGWEGEGVPTNLDEYFDMMKIDSESVDVAGTEGFITKNTYEDGNSYGIHATFRPDGTIYEADLSVDAWDENGLKEDAAPLSDDDIAVFKSFLASITKK